MKSALVLTLAGCVSTALLSGGCHNDQNTTHNSGHATASVSSSASASATPTPASPVEARASGDAVAPAVDADQAIAAAAKDEAAKVSAARAEVEPSKAPGNDDVKGVVTFTAAGDGVKVHYHITGLAPGKHGFHIHEKGDLSDPKLTSAGGHFNPAGHKHGGPTGEMRHGGDLGNITADDKGVAEGDVSAMGVTLDESKTGILGRSIVVHDKTDDMQTDPSGNSGDRIAAGVIKAVTSAPQGEKDANNPARK